MERVWAACARRFAQHRLDFDMRRSSFAALNLGNNHAKNRKIVEKCQRLGRLHASREAARRFTMQISGLKENNNDANASTVAKSAQLRHAPRTSARASARNTFRQAVGGR